MRNNNYNNNKLSNFSTKKIPEIFKFDFQVYVRCYNLKGDQLNLFNFITYKLEGFYDNREFLIERRYKEFILFRKFLSNNWPGIIIPPIPPKRAFGNMEEGFIKLRKKFLQNFFNKIASAPHLATAEETRIFLDPNTKNFLELSNEKFYKNFSQINTFYDEYFYFLKNFEINLQHKKAIDEFFALLKKTKETLENIVLITTEAQNSKLEFDKEIESLYENLYELDNNYIYDINKIEKEKKIELNKDVVESGLLENMYRTKFMDIFTCFFEWSNMELIETDSIIDGISSIFKIKDNYEKKSAVYKNEKNYLNKLINPFWIKKLIFSSDDELIKQQTEKVNYLKREVDALENLLDLTYKILLYIEIPVFKNDRLEFYHKFIASLHNCDQNENEKISSITKNLKNHCTNLLNVYSSSLFNSNKDLKLRDYIKELVNNK